jgi:hypothetical protein
MKKLAPIVLFTYNRLNTLRTTIQFLKKNKLANYSNIYIYSDFYKSNADKHNVLKVRKYLKSIKGFNQKKIILRKKNYGLAKNIINGVGEVLKGNTKVIVLEDDIKVSKYFLDYMNQTLNLYKNKKKIWHISGWNYNVKVSNSYDAYFTRTMNCWGWATWKDRWKYFNKNPNEIIKKWSNKDVYKFNFDGSYNFFSQIERNKSKKINTWAIFWYATIFQNKGLCLNPKKTLVSNIGIGNSASNTKSFDDVFNGNASNLVFLPKKFPTKLTENKYIFSVIRNKFLIMKVRNKIKYFFKRLVIKNKD